MNKLHILNLFNLKLKAIVWIEVILNMILRYKLYNIHTLNQYDTIYLTYVKYKIPNKCQNHLYAFKQKNTTTQHST